MVTQVLSVPNTVQKYKWYAGQWKSMYTGLSNVDVNLTSGKTSVDSGCFTPGVYRTNPYEVYRTEIGVEDVDLDEHIVTYRGVIYKFVVTGGIVPIMFAGVNTQFPSILADLEKQALQKAYAKLAASDLNLGEALGEIRETLQMLINPFDSLRKYLRSGNKPKLKTLKDVLTFLKTGRFGGSTGPSAAKAATDAWMEIRYGLRPLLYLIGDLVDELNKKKAKTFDPKKIRSVKARVEQDTKDFLNSPVSVGLVSGTCDYEVTDKLTAFASVQYRQTSEFSIPDNLGLSPRHWPELAWELTRLSFVWDWVVSIGPWLGTLRFKPEISVLGNTTGRKLKRTFVSKNFLLYTYYGDYPGNPIKGNSFGNTRVVVHRYKRAVDSSLPLTPLIRNDSVFDIYKIIDLLSIIYQRTVK